MEKSSRVGTAPRLGKAADPHLQSEASGRSVALAGGCCRCGLLSGSDHSSLCLLQTKPASLPHVNELGPTMGPVALLGSAVILDVSSPFFPGRLEDQGGDGNEGGVPGLPKGVCACLFDRASPRGEFHVLTTGGWREALRHLKACPVLGQCRHTGAESREGACYRARRVPGLLGSLV